MIFVVEGVELRMYRNRSACTFTYLILFHNRELETFLRMWPENVKLSTEID